MTLTSYCRQLAGTAGFSLAAPTPSGVKLDSPRWPAPSSYARAVTLPPLTGAPPSTIAKRAAQVTAAFLIDHSGSMYGTWGDPTGIRCAAAESVIRLQRRTGGGRAVIVPWGSTAPAEMVTGPIEVKRGLKTLKHALVIPPTLGGNDLPAALRRAREILAQPTPDQAYLIYVITDGIEPVTTDMHDAVAALPPRSVHLCLVDRSNGCTPDMEADWATVAFGSFTRLNHLDVRTMAVELAHIYASSLDVMLAAVTERQRRRK